MKYVFISNINLSSFILSIPLIPIKHRPSPNLHTTSLAVNNTPFLNAAFCSKFNPFLVSNNCVSNFTLYSVPKFCSKFNTFFCDRFFPWACCLVPAGWSSFWSNHPALVYTCNPSTDCRLDHFFGDEGRLETFCWIHSPLISSIQMLLHLWNDQVLN